MMRRTILSWLVLITISISAVAQEPIPAPDLETDADFRKATPLGRLKVIAEHFRNDQPPKGATRLIQENVIRHVHQAGSGHAAAELLAYGELAKLAADGGPLTGINLRMDQRRHWMNWTFFAAMTRSAKWQAADTLERLASMIRIYHRKLFGGYEQSNQLKMLIYEYVHQQSRNLPLEERAAARLAAYRKLNTMGIDGEKNFGFGEIPSQLPYVYIEYFLHDATASKLGPGEQFEHFAELAAQNRIDPWTRLDIDLLLAPAALRANPAFMKRDADGRREMLSELMQDGRIGRFANRYLEVEFCGPQDGSQPTLHDLLALRTDYAGATAKDKLLILAEIAGKQKVDRNQLKPRVRKLLYAHIQSGSSSQPLRPLVELQRAEQLRATKVGDKQPLKGFSYNDLSAALELALVAHLTDHAAFQRADAVGRARIVEELRRSGLAGSRGVNMVKTVIVSQAIAADTAKVRPASRGMARLKSLQQFRAAEFDHNTLPLSDEIKAALYEHLLYDERFQQQPPRQQLAYLANLEQQQLIHSFARSDSELPIAIRMLEQDAKFTNADNAGKLAILDQLKEDSVVDFFSVSKLKRYFKVSK